MSRDQDHLENVVARIRADVIGDGMPILTPYGWRRLSYADQTASGRALGAVEDAIRELVLPSYGNTHTEGSFTGRRTTLLREQARDLIRSAVHGDDSTAVIFCGSGSTGAVDKLVGILGLRAPGRHRGAPPTAATEPRLRPVVFVGPYEHHSNELPWRESVADVVVIPPDEHGQPDLGRLEQELSDHQDRPLLVGSFSAGSNVTGIITDVDAVSALLRRFGALVCWDYASAAAHLPVQMVQAGTPVKDAVFLSPHKLPGGPGTPGILLVRRDLVTNVVPTVPGGGTVTFVSSTVQHYTDDVEGREEGGTPDIIGAIRAGLAFRVRDLVGVDAIAHRERLLVAQLLSALTPHTEVEVLGDVERPRMGVVSFRVRDPRGPAGRYLHHDFVVAVLSDLFGVQARGGCSCAGPYGHRLLGIDADLSAVIEAQVLAGDSGLKPGWVRLSVAYYMSPALVRYLGDAVDLVARAGHRLLPHYRFDVRTGVWSHRSARPAEPSLLDLSLGGTEGAATPEALPESVLDQHLAEARAILAALPEPRPGPGATPDRVGDGLRWFDASP